MGSPIVFTDVKKSYESPPVFVVHDFSLSVNQGEFFCLVGLQRCRPARTDHAQLRRGPVGLRQRMAARSFWTKLLTCH